MIEKLLLILIIILGLYMPYCMLCPFLQEYFLDKYRDKKQKEIELILEEIKKRKGL